MRTDASSNNRSAKNIQQISKQIIAALSHPEAQDGLYFRNLYHLHEEDQRDAVEGSQEDILEALRALIVEKKVRIDESGDEVIFFLV